MCYTLMSVGQKKQKAFQYVKRILLLFHAVVNFCTTKRLFKFAYAITPPIFYLFNFLLFLSLVYKKLFSKWHIAGKSLPF